ncbi:MAG: alpha/beta hydrolase [Phycisphaerales bacterium]|nr:alpha/beta hydrolase [Phycisphaerales bacterium]
MGNPEIQLTKRQRVTFFILNLCTLVVLWLALWPWKPHWSERFYLVVPWAFACGSLWLLVLHQRRAAIARAAIAASMLIAVLAAAFYERRHPVEDLMPGELAEFARGFVAVLIVSSWIWTGLSASLAPILRVRTESKRLHRIAARLAVILVFSVIANGYLMAVLQTHFPKRSSNMTPATIRREYAVVHFTARDGIPLVGWFVPCEGSERTAIVCHGVGAYKADMIDFVDALVEGGYNVFTFDFRGHGESGGHTISYGKYEKLDVLAAVDWLKQKHADESRHIVGVAWSMGAATMLLAAAEDTRIEALHIDAAYARTRDIAAVIAAPFPPVYQECGTAIGLLIGSLECGANLYTLAPIDVIASIAPRPIMIVHGDVDPLIPLAQGKQLFEAAGEPKQFVIIKGAGHCQTITIDTPDYQRRMVAFLNDALAETPKR